MAATYKGQPLGPAPLAVTAVPAIAAPTSTFQCNATAPAGFEVLRGSPSVWVGGRPPFLAPGETFRFKDFGVNECAFDAVERFDLKKLFFQMKYFLNK